MYLLLEMQNYIVITNGRMREGLIIELWDETISYHKPR